MEKISNGILKRFGYQYKNSSSPSSIAKNNLLPSPLLLAPTFPAFTALVTLADSSPVKKPRSDSLFLNLIQDPKVLLQDLLASPHKYEEGVSELVQDLSSGRRDVKDLERQEMDLLDRATIDYSHAEKPRKVIPPPVRAKAEKPTPEPRPPSLSPDGLEPYWWLNT